MRTVLEGAVAGAVATGAMSVPMLIAQRQGSMGTQPPERVVEEAESETGRTLSEREENLAASLAHLGFGVGSGALFAVVHRALRLPVPTVVQGTGFAVAVWALSYKGWIPRLGVLPPPEGDRSDRQRTMVAVHLVFGAVLGAVEHRLADRR
ncbi:MAG TPA: DUF6789 family protein [Acidimicrobiales bacterium]|nr:DUF6789 family protein [Acidimicrobiales bacterium]